jgi:hypothetical protein
MLPKFRALQSWSLAFYQRGTSLLPTSSGSGALNPQLQRALTLGLAMSLLKPIWHRASVAPVEDDAVGAQLTAHPLRRSHQLGASLYAEVMAISRAL